MTTLALSLNAPRLDALWAHRPYLMRFARQRLRDAAWVEDLVQETLLAALQGAAAYAGRASLRTWLTGILLHRIADHLRRERRHAPEATSAAGASADGSDDDVPADGVQAHAEPVDRHDPLRLLEARQSLESLHAGLARLPELSARAFRLREFDGLSNQDTARRLGISASHCAVLLHRARARLREHLSGFN